MPADAPRNNIKSRHRLEWQARLRDDCLQRVQQQRQKLLQKCRTEPVQQCLQSVLSDVASNAQPSSSNFDTIARQHPDDAAGKDSKGRYGAIVAEDTNSNGELWYKQLSEEEHQELLAKMEEALFEEGYRDELEAIEAAELEDISDMFAAHCIMDTFPHQEVATVLCPVCEKADLAESAFGTISCQLCKYKIEGPMPGGGSSLNCLADSLARSLEGHSASGCTEKPYFFVKQISSSNLYMACYECGAFEVLL